MGASTLAFFPTRSALVSEGPSELIMLPTLLREATGLEELRFQITPGGANAKPAHISGLDLQAPEIAWVVDGDKGGRERAKYYRRNGIPKERIVALGGADSGRVMEDFVAPQVYVDAVNEEIGRRGADDALTIGDLSAKNRPRDVEQWCTARGVASPDKIAVAHHVVEMRTTDDLVEPDRLELLREYHAAVLVALKSDSP